MVDYITEARGNNRLPGIMTLGYIAAFSETLALAVVALVLTFSKILGDASAEGAEQGNERAPLRFLQRLQLWSLIAQFSLGVLATIAIYFILTFSPQCT